MKNYSITYNSEDKSKSKHNVPDEMIIRLAPNTSIKEFNNSNYFQAIHGFSITDEQLSHYTPLYLNYGKIMEVYIVDLSNVYNNDKQHYAYKFPSEDWVLTVREQSKKNKSITYLRIINRNELTKAPQKLFLDKDELIDFYNKARDKRNKQLKYERELFNSTNNGPIQFETPRLKVVEINKSSDHIPNVKIGDVIYGAIKVLDENGKNIMNVSSKYVNYITVYVNGEKVNVLPMSKFGDLISKHFKLSAV